MRKPQPHHRETEFGALTSMIDVVLFLLMYFVVTAGGSAPEQLLPADLPDAGQVASASPVAVPAAPLSVQVLLKLFPSADGEHTVVDMNGTRYDRLDQVLGQLRALAALDPANPVILDVADTVPLQDFVAVFDTCQAAGFENVNLTLEAGVSGSN